MLKIHDLAAELFESLVLYGDLLGLGQEEIAVVSSLVFIDTNFTPISVHALK